MDQRPTEQVIIDFFRAYAQRFNECLANQRPADVRSVRAAFAPYFVESSPVGVRGGKNGLLFRWMVPRGLAYYRRIGARRMQLAEMEITALDPLHALCKVSWHSEYQRADGSETSIDFDVIYLLRLTEGEPRIFAYITGDEQRALEEHGLSAGAG